MVLASYSFIQKKHYLWKNQIPYHSINYASDDKISKRDILKLIIAGPLPSTYTHDIKKILEENLLGGIYISKDFFIYKDENYTEKPRSINNQYLYEYVKKLNSKRKKEDKFFIAVDYESRFKSFIDEYFKIKQDILKNNNKIRYPLLSIGTSHNLDFAYLEGRKVSELLSYYGINTIFGPVLDMKTSFTDTNLQNRSFGRDPNLIYYLSTAYILGLYYNNIIPVIKHFPGHPSKTFQIDNPHEDISDSFLCEETILNNNALPFFKLIKNPFLRISMLMTDHSRKEESGSYFYLIKSKLKDILRNKFKYEGIIITDDLNMLYIIERSKYFRKNLNIKSLKTARAKAKAEILKFNKLSPDRQKEIIDFYYPIIKEAIIAGHDMLLFREASLNFLHEIAKKLGKESESNNKLYKYLVTAYNKVNYFKKNVLFNKMLNEYVFPHYTNSEVQNIYKSIPGFLNINLFNNSLKDNNFLDKLEMSKKLIISSFIKEDDFIKVLKRNNLINNEDKLIYISKFKRNRQLSDLSYRTSLIKKAKEIIKLNLANFDYILISSIDHRDFLIVKYIFDKIKTTNEGNLKKIILFLLSVPDKIYIDIRLDDIKINNQYTPKLECTIIKKTKVQEILSKINVIALFENSEFAVQNYIDKVSNFYNVNIKYLPIDLPNYYYYNFRINKLKGKEILWNIANYEKVLLNKKNIITWFLFFNEYIYLTILSFQIIVLYIIKLQIKLISGKYND